jgi:hypothetical protein
MTKRSGARLAQNGRNVLKDGKPGTLVRKNEKKLLKELPSKRIKQKAIRWSG